MAVFDDVKLLLGSPTGRDSLIQSVIKLTEKRLAWLLQAEAVPEELEYIVTEVSVARFNRIGSEGTSSHTVEGETMVLSDDDFDKYADDIAAYKKASSGYGVLRFL